MIDCSLTTTENAPTVYAMTGDDQTPPIIRCQDVTIALDQNGNSNITTADATLMAFDDDGMGNLSID